MEGIWLSYSSPLPPVERLSFHLPNQQYVVYKGSAYVAQLIDNPRVCESQFLSWMELNAIDEDAHKLTYSEFPTKYVYQKWKRTWKARKRGMSIGRMTHVSPSAGELYYLRLLLTKVRGPTDFDDIKTYENVVYPTFKDACFARGLLDDDHEYISAIKEAATWASGKSLRKLFVSMLQCGSLKQPDFVWKETTNLLSEDLLYVPRPLTSASSTFHNNIHRNTQNYVNDFNTFQNYVN